MRGVSRVGRLNYKVPSSVKGKTVLITGANTGIGRTAALALAAQGARLFLAGRSEERTRPVIDEIDALGGPKAEYLALDLGSFESVRACAAAFKATGAPLDILINNAGLAGFKGLTKDGFEMMFGVNHLGHFLLTLELLELLVDASPSRIVHVASRAHTRVKKVDLDGIRAPATTTTGMPEYSSSKLANILFSNELARRLEGTGVTSYALHPGVVASDVWREVPWPIRDIMKFFMISNEEGAMTTLYCATAEEVAGHSGRYYDECKEKKPTSAALDEAAAKVLWDKSLEWTGATWPL